jgi:hypothetical protein
MSDVAVDKLVEVYIKIRDAKEAEMKKAAAIEAEFNSQLEVIERELLEVCKATGANSIKTNHGTAMRSTKSRY